MRVLICGSRDWQYPDDIDAFVKSLPKDAVIIEGACRGADSQARASAIYHNLEYETYPAKWSKYGKGAGVIRNREMIDKGKPDLVVAFHDDLSKSRGTLNMITQAMGEGIEVKVYGHSKESKKINDSVIQILKQSLGRSMQC
jgi:hypothetical protein